MKIAILGIKGVPGHHGVEVVVDSLLPHLNSLGHDITVYGYNSYTSPTDDYRGARIRTINGSSRKNFEMVSHMWSSSLDSRRGDYDLVHIHSTDPCLLAWLPKARYGVVATSHGQAYARKKWSFIARTLSKTAERFFIYFPDLVTSVSKPLADYYTKKYNKEIRYIPNGIKLREKPDVKFLEKWDLKPHNFLFCSAGRIEKTKGLHTLFEAYNKLRIDLPLIIAGGGSGTDFKYFDDLKKDKPDGAKFVGFLTGDELYALYAYARVFAFPSEYEAMSMAFLEGLSFGVPTVYSDIPENIAVANGLGYSFSVSNSDSMAEQLIYVLKNYNEAEKRARKAKDVIKRNHDWRSIAAQYNDIYLQFTGAK